MTILTVVPTRIELNPFLKAFRAQGYHSEAALAGGLPVNHFPAFDTTIALGGLGKTRFAHQTQHLIAAGHWDLVICAGGAGALISGLAVGDVVIATEMVEYDTRKITDSLQLPRFITSEGILRQFRQVLPAEPAFRVRYGPIVTTDNFFMGSKQRPALQKRTGALVVAMEGTGGARLCQASSVPFIEIRAVTDQANILSVFNFFLHLNQAMNNLAQVVISLASDTLKASRAG